jgi:glucose/arabinose dehydrogenase
LVAATVALAGVVPAAAAPGDPVPDPIPQRPVVSDLGLTLTQWTTFPQSNPVPAPTDDRLVRRARINYLGEIPDGSGRRYVPDLNGRLYTLPPSGGTPQVYLDVRARAGSNFFSGRGLGSGFGFVAFHPDFATNGRFYTTHSEAFGALTSATPDWTQPNAVVHSVLTEWTATNPAATTFSGTRRQLMRLGFASYIHAIQQIDLNPNARPGDPDYGLLYVAVGDGGIGYQTTVPQDLAVPHGKILRIDPRGTNSANGAYGIPASNPFAGRPGARGEIFALGMRDPHRFSWDRGGSGQMFLGHIGEHDIEGVYDVRAGDNLGWSEREGAFVFDRSNRCTLFELPADDARFGYTYPVAAYDHDPPPGTPCGADVGRAISGGFVYRGDALPALRGKYVFGDLVDGRVFYTEVGEMRRGAGLATLYQLRLFTAAGAETSMPGLAGDSRVDMRFGTDRAGELYVLAKANGRIWKVTGTRGGAPGTRYEAENATISQGVVESNHAGFTGTGFVNYANVAGGYVQWTVTAAQTGAATLTFRYANGTATNRPMAVAVNGATAAASLAFPGTGAWTTWATRSVTVNLNAGANTVRATGTTSAGGPNVDSLTLG